MPSMANHILATAEGGFLKAKYTFLGFDYQLAEMGCEPVILDPERGAIENLRRQIRVFILGVLTHASL